MRTGIAAGPAPRLEHRDTVHLGQADIEDDRVIGFAFAEKVTLFAIEGTIDHISRVSECGRKLPVEIGIVLDYEETHGKCSQRCATPGSALAAVTLPLHRNRGKVEEDPRGSRNRLG